MYDNLSNGDAKSLRSLRKFWPGCDVRRPKTCTGNNRAVIKSQNGPLTLFMFHGTIVVSYCAKMKVLTVHDGGWASITTRKAIEQGVGELTGLRAVCRSGRKMGWDHTIKVLGREQLFDAGGTVTFEV